MRSRTTKYQPRRAIAGRGTEEGVWEGKPKSQTSPRVYVSGYSILTENSQPTLLERRFACLGLEPTARLNAPAIIVLASSGLARIASLAPEKVIVRQGLDPLAFGKSDATRTEIDASDRHLRVSTVTVTL